MNKKIIALALLPLLATSCHDNKKRDYNKYNGQNVYYNTEDNGYVNTGCHSHVFYPIMVMHYGHYYQGGYDSPSARSYYSGSATAANNGRMYSTSSYAKSSGFSSKASFSGGSVSRGGFGHSSSFSSAS